VFGPLSEFLSGLGHHLTDIRPIEILTLAPLGALIVILGLFPGLLLGLIDGTVTDVIAAVHGAATAGLIR
jgi:NADH:ubiquinone oxidoreductase subunit 4 (subunit M)